MEIDVGARLKKVRNANGLSQRQLARQAGVTNGLISMIEQNRSSPSVASLKRILDAVPISFAAFFAEEYPDTEQVFFRSSELREINPARVFRLDDAAAEGLSVRQVGPARSGALQLLHEVYAPGADTGEELYAHDGEEAGLIVSGELEVTVGTETALLGPGDAYAFDSRVPHRFRNTGRTECRLVSACTPATF